MPLHFISLGHLALAASLVDPEMGTRILDGQTSCGHHHLRSQLLENRWLEAERGAGDAEKCSTPSPGYGPSSLCSGQVPGLLFALILYHVKRRGVTGDKGGD